MQQQAVSYGLLFICSGRVLSLTGALALAGQRKLSRYLLISSFYKAFTGRPGPRHGAVTLIDTSKEFHFGFLKGGVFFGWPSSHTTVAFAVAAAIWRLYPGSKAVRSAALLYAIYVGVGVSMTIHWFSDFVAGAIIGTTIGMTVGNVFKERLLHSAKK